MMLEQSLISPNFLGKESFRWFIGRVSQYVSTEKGGYKAKVRIIGHHPGSKNVIDESDLPWAHVLVPLHLGAGSKGTGMNANIDGGETVIGFFMDGDNGQQPVIIGALFSGYDIDYSNTFDKGTDNFDGFIPSRKPINPLLKDSKTGKIPNKSATGIPNPTAGIGTDNKKSQGTEATNIGAPTNRQVISIPPTCKNSNTTYGRLVRALRDFIKTLNTINQTVGIVNTVTNAVADLPALVQETGQIITDLFHEYCTFIRDKINKRLYKYLKGKLDKLLPKDIKLFEELAMDKLVDSIWCAFNKIIKGIAEFITKFLLEIVDKVISVPLCAAESFLGSVLSNITSQISEALSGILGDLTSVIGPISSYVSQALNYANAALNFLSCESAECKAHYDYEMNKGFIPPETIEGINNVVNYPRKGLQNAKKAAREWLGLNNAGKGDDALPPELAGLGQGCDVTSLECGLPTVTFFGGGGVGAAGLAVVDAIGQVAGVNMTNFGLGYSGAPYISFDDPCGNGAGASGTVYVENGQVSKVQIDNPGYGYLNSTTYTGSTDDPCTTPLIDSSGQEVVGSITAVNIIKPGIGYTSGDRIVDEACPLNDIEIYPVVDSFGRITDVNIINPGSSIRVLPQLEINSPDGEGAIIQPVLTFNPVKPVGIGTDPLKIKKVVLCAEDHGL